MERMEFGLLNAFTEPGQLATSKNANEVDLIFGFLRLFVLYLYR